MSKIKLLLDVVSDMRSLADSIETVANAILFSITQGCMNTGMAKC